MNNKDDFEVEVSSATCKDKRIIVELVSRPNHNPPCTFAVWSPERGSYRLAEKFELASGQVALPPQDSLIGRVVLIPSGIREYGNNLQLLDELQGFIHRYVDVSLSYEKLVAYYVLLTWVFDRFSSLPYLRVLGGYGQGKTRFLEVVGSIVYRGIFLAGVTSRAALYRLINRYQGTLLLDEGDFTRGALSSDMVKILNLGTSPTFEIVLCSNSPGLESFKVYSPKIIATRKSFEDKALESRCLTERMKGGPREDIPKVLPEEFKSEAQKLRNKLLLWRFRNYFRVGPGYIPKLGGTARFSQLLSPLFSVAQMFGSDNDLEGFAERYCFDGTRCYGNHKAIPVLKALFSVLKRVENPTIKMVSREYNLGKEIENRITPRKCGYILREVLGLSTQFDGKNYRVAEREEEIRKRCARFVLNGPDRVIGLQ